MILSWLYTGIFFIIIDILLSLKVYLIEIDLVIIRLWMTHCYLCAQRVNGSEVTATILQQCDKMERSFNNKFTTYSHILTISCSNTKVFLLHCSFSTHVIVHTRMLYHQALICLQRYSQSRRPHGSWPFHDFGWYNSWNSHKPWMELAAGMAPGGGSNQEEWLLAALWIALLMSICAFLRPT